MGCGDWQEEAEDEVKRRALKKRYGRSAGNVTCVGGHRGVRGMIENVRGQVRCPYCLRYLFPKENPNGPPFMVLPTHSKHGRRYQ